MDVHSDTAGLFSRRNRRKAGNTYTADSQDTLLPPATLPTHEQEERLGWET